MMNDDTIAAVSTAYGEGGIGIVRMSGENAREILNEIFAPRSGKALRDRRMTYGQIVDPETKEIVDEALAVFMPAPNTYTREDVAEINCHGSAVALRKTLALTLRRGARPAGPGEFTKRAFLNGRLDLSQAEAVIDMVRAKTDRGFTAALDQLEGALSSRVRRVRSALTELLVKITVNLEYPDEDIEEIAYRELKNSVSEIGDVIEELLSTADRGRVVRDGLSAVISGSPNVGKSSLLNALLNENRAIVTKIPGTTRDTIEEMVNINGIPVKLIDTAGIRDPRGAIEKIGIERSKEAFQKADLILLVVDGSERLTNETRARLAAAADRPVIVLLNKSDLARRVSKEEIETVLPGRAVLRTAATKAEGLDALAEEIEKMVFGGAVKQSESLLVTNARHKRLLEQAAEALADARAMTERGEALDFIEVDLRNCWSFLGEIIGETASEEIIDKIFSDFCLGK